MMVKPDASSAAAAQEVKAIALLRAPGAPAASVQP